jgi:hypothetical protein
MAKKASKPKKPKTNDIKTVTKLRDAAIRVVQQQRNG